MVVDHHRPVSHSSCRGNLAPEAESETEDRALHSGWVSHRACLCRKSSYVGARAGAPGRLRSGTRCPLLLLLAIGRTLHVIFPRAYAMTRRIAATRRQNPSVATAARSASRMDS